MQPPRTFWSCPEFCVVASGFGLPLVQVHLVRDTTQLDQLVQELEATLREVDDLVDHYTAQRRRRKRVKPASVGKFSFSFGQDLPKQRSLLLLASTWLFAIWYVAVREQL